MVRRKVAKMADVRKLDFRQTGFYRQQSREHVFLSKHIQNVVRVHILCISTILSQHIITNFKDIRIPSLVTTRFTYFYGMFSFFFQI